LTKGTFSDHLEKTDLVLQRLQKAGLEVNVTKSFFARSQLECPGHWITRTGIKPVCDKVKAVLKIAEPENQKELRSFIGVANCHRDMWVRRSHVLAPLAALTSKTSEWKWEPQHQKAFAMAERVIAKETLSARPNFNEPFQICTDASHCQSGAVASQDGKPIAFCGRKLNPAQTRCTAAERELPSTAETLKECRNMLLGQQIEVFTDHENPVCKHFNTERVMRWRLLSEEFGPELTCVKGANDVVADALSRLDIAEEEFSAEAFANELANEEEDFPTGCPLSHKEPAFRQVKDRALQNKFRTQPELHIEKPRVFSDSTCELVAENNIVCVPESPQHKCAEWCHLTSMHPGEQRLELTAAQRCAWIGLRATRVRACKRCENCTAS